MGKPHGIAGEVYVEPISDDPRRFDPGSVLVHERLGELEIESARRHRDRLLVRFAGVADRDAAESLRGVLYVPGDMLRELDAGEFWEHEVVGCLVVDAEGNELGPVTRLVPGAAQDLIAVATGAGERLVPLVAEIVTDVDVERRVIHVDPPPGLLD